MPFDSSGTFNRVIPGGWKADATAGIKIRADRHDDEDDGFAVGLSTCITKDGRTQPTANIPLNNKRITSLADPTDPQDAVNKNYVDNKFGSAFTITGVDDAGRINFSGSQSPLATGKPLGFSFTQADLFFGVKPTNVETAGKLPRWVWNNKGDGMGTDVANMTEAGLLTVASDVVNNGYFRSSTVSAVLATNAAGAVYLRPNGRDSGTGQAVLNSGGNLVVGGQVVAGTALIAYGGAMAIADNGTGLRYMQFAPQWSFTWNTSTGRLAYSVPGGEWMSLDGANNVFQVSMNAYKPGGGSWLASSDLRVKDVRGSYDHGLEEILQVNPVRYHYKKTPDVEYIGVVAQEIEGIMPETVSLIEGEVDGATVTDLRAFDNTALIYALINAVKTLSAKVEALEAQLAGAP